MAEAHHPATSAPEISSASRSDGNEAADFECNICFELAQDPVITLCGHLYCWPCLYKWLKGHSQSHECPVCKALIDEEKAIPLYGRGKTPLDPRSKPVPGVETPNRPAGQRTDSIHFSDNNLAGLVMGLMAGFLPVASANFSNFGMSAGFGGLVFPFFSIQLNGISNANGGGGSSGYNYGYANGSFRGSERGWNREASQDDENLKKILIVVLLLVLFAFLTM